VARNRRRAYSPLQGSGKNLPAPIRFCHYGLYGNPLGNRARKASVSAALTKAFRVYRKLQLAVHPRYSKCYPEPVKGEIEIVCAPPCSFVLEPAESCSQYVALWSSAARAGLGLAGVFVDSGSGNSPGLDELRRLIARGAVDVILAWSADCLSHALRDELCAAGCGLYSYGPGAPPPAVEPEQNVQTGIARARAQGKLGRPRVDSATEEAVQAALATGKGIRKVAREVGVGVSVVQRVRAERLGQAGSA
jgi:hypothetical protein